MNSVSWKLCVLSGFIALLSAQLVCAQDQKKTGSGDPKAIEFLRQVEMKIYSPVREGLKTLSFSRLLNTKIGDIGKENYWFKAPDRYKYEIELNQDHPQRAALEETMKTDKWINEVKGLSTLGIYLGTYMTRNIDEFEVNFIGLKTNTARIRCKVKPDSWLAPYHHSYDFIFDETGMLRAIKTIDATGNTQMQQYRFMKLKDTELSYLHQVELMTNTPQGTLKAVQTFHYKEIKGFHLITKTDIEFPELKESYTLDSLDLKINEPLNDSLWKNTGENTGAGGNKIEGG